MKARMWEEGYLQGGREEGWSIKWDNTPRNDEGWYMRLGVRNECRCAYFSTA